MEQSGYFRTEIGNSSDIRTFFQFHTFLKIDESANRGPLT